MILWFIFIVFIPISLLDLRLMGKYELKYWAMLLVFGEKHPELLEEAKKLKDEASGAVSIGQFAFWYAMLGLALAFIANDTTVFFVTLGGIVFLHWAGLEDLLYFLEDIVLQWLPESWWKTREQIKITTKRRLPKFIPWMIVPKKIWFISIPMLWVRMFTGNGGKDGQDVKFWRFAIGVLVAVVAVIAIACLFE